MDEVKVFTRLIDTLQAQPVLTLFLILGACRIMGDRSEGVGE